MSILTCAQVGDEIYIASDTLVCSDGQIAPHLQFKWVVSQNGDAAIGVPGWLASMAMLEKHKDGIFESKDPLASIRDAFKENPDFKPVSNEEGVLPSFFVGDMIACGMMCGQWGIWISDPTLTSFDEVAFESCVFSTKTRPGMRFAATGSGAEYAKGAMMAAVDLTESVNSHTVASLGVKSACKMDVYCDGFSGHYLLKKKERGK